MQEREFVVLWTEFVWIFFIVWACWVPPVLSLSSPSLLPWEQYTYFFHQLIKPPEQPISSNRSNKSENVWPRHTELGLIFWCCLGIFTLLKYLPLKDATDFAAIYLALVWISSMCSPFHRVGSISWGKCSSNLQSLRRCSYVFCID